MALSSDKKRIAIIGCGYVGSALGEALAKAGHDVIGTTTKSRRLNELRRLGITPEIIEVSDSRRLHEILADRDTVYLTVAPGSYQGDYRAVYLAAGESLIAAARSTPVRRIIYTSSTRVYAQTDGAWVDESSPTEPQDKNGRILLGTERVLRDGAKSLPGDAPVRVTIVRLSGIHGPGRDLAERIRSRAGTERSGGDAYVNLAHRNAIVEALAALLHVQHEGILNLTDGHPQRRRELYDRVLAESGLDPIRWIPGDQPANLGKRVRSDLIRKTLGLALDYPNPQSV